MTNKKEGTMTTPEYIGLPTTTDEESPENRTNHYRTNKMMLEMGFTWCKDGFWENEISYRYDQKQATDLVDRIMNLITLHTKKARKQELKQLTVIEFENGDDDFLYYDYDEVSRRIKQLTNPTEAGGL